MPLRGPRQRALLAFLLVNANEVVADERLLEELWGGEPPESGLAALRVRVSQLRKALPEGDTLIRARPRLRARRPCRRPRRRRFERLLADGSKALAAGRAEAAATTLRDALALWRGPALADFAYEQWAQAEAAASRSSAGAPSRSGSRPSSRSGATPTSSASSRRWSPRSRCASAFAAS